MLQPSRRLHYVQRSTFQGALSIHLASTHALVAGLTLVIFGAQLCNQPACGNNC